MRRHWIAIALCIFGFPLWAQEVVVRTGDHPTFTRIVLSMPPGTEWELTKVRNGYSLSVNETIGINTDLFFERIQRNRIATVQPGPSPSEILLDLACDCFAEAFQWRPDQVVIDVKDPGSAKSADVIPIRDARSDSEHLAEDLPPPPLPKLQTQGSTRIDLPLVMSQAERPLDRQLSIDPLGQILTQRSRVGNLEATIAASLGRALSQGLLEPGQETQVPASELPIEEELASLLADLESALAPGVIARTSVDRELQPTLTQDEVAPPVTCIPNSLIDVPSWQSDMSFSTLLGELRTKVTGEFDRTDPTAIENLAKAYISFGFGREAISTLSIDGAKSRSREVLHTLAEIIDNDPLTADDFHLQVGCTGHVALWALLSHQNGPLAAQPNVNEIIVSFKLLPKPLRQHLAPRLSRKLNELGFPDFATDVLSISSNQNIEAVTAETEILIDRGATDEAAVRLAELVEDDARMTPEALMTLIKIDLADGKAIAANEMTLLRTFQFEVKDEALRRELNATEISILIAMGSYNAALALIGSYEPQIPEALATEFRADIFERIVTNGNDADFLTKAFDRSQNISDTANQNAFATRLINLGFPKRAQELVSGQAIGDDMMERRYLRAEAALALNERASAEAHLAGINTSRARQLLASEAEDSESTFAESNALQNDSNADPLLSTIAARVQEITVFAPNSQTPLTDSRALLDQSTDLRSDMTSLLDRFQINP